MAFSLKYLCLLLALVTLFHQGASGCSRDDIRVVTEITGRRPAGQLEWKVTVTNNCDACKMGQIVLAAYGFQSAEPVDPALFAFSGIYGTVNKGLPINPHQSISFYYARTPSVPFRVVDAVPLCT